jgi:hypothetical protein
MVRSRSAAQWQHGISAALRRADGLVSVRVDTAAASVFPLISIEAAQSQGATSLRLAFVS